MKYHLWSFILSKPNSIGVSTLITSVSYSKKFPDLSTGNLISVVPKLLYIPAPSLNVSLLGWRSIRVLLNEQYLLYASSPATLFRAPSSIQIPSHPSFLGFLPNKIVLSWFGPIEISLPASSECGKACSARTWNVLFRSSSIICGELLLATGEKLVSLHQFSREYLITNRKSFHWSSSNCWICSRAFLNSSESLSTVSIENTCFVRRTG